MKEAILFIILAVINYSRFSYDQEDDRDFYNWLWLCNSVLCLILILWEVMKLIM